MSTPELHEGDEIEITGIMPDEPNPVPVGSRGTVLAVLNRGREYEQYAIQWHGIKRGLMVLPEDPFRVVE